MAHHQEADGVHAQVTRVLNVLLRDVGFGAVRGHPHDAGASFVGLLQVMDGADAWEQQRGHFRVLQHISHRRDPFEVGVGAEAIVEA
ncbi:hypothetical protein D3C72_2067400 [compost metagenome]